MEFVGDGVLEIVFRLLWVEIEDEGGIGSGFVDEAVGLGLDHRINFGMDNGALRQKSEYAACGGVEVGAFPCVEGLLESRSFGECLEREDEFAKFVVGEVAVHGGFALL